MTTHPAPPERELVAPPNSLPDWTECWSRVLVETESALHRFIYEYDDADSIRSGWFLHRLELLLNETKEAATRAATVPQGVSVRGYVNGYLPRQRAIEVILDGAIPEWLTKLQVGVSITATPPPAELGKGDL